MSNLEGPARLMFEEVRGRAAVVGTFDPLELVAGAAGQEVRFQVLDELAAYCEEIETEDAVLWRLVPDERRAILSELSEQGRLEDVASSAGSIETDKFGEYLLGGVLGTLDIEKGAEDLSSLHAAVQFVQPHSPSAPDPREVETRLRREEAVAAIDFLLPLELIGREDQLASLDAFVTAPQNKDLPSRWMIVTGIGGSGKSATLAAFAKRHLRPDWSGPPTIWLDFDRPLLSSADPIVLILELSRQLALFRPGLASALSEFRAATKGISMEGSYDPGRSESLSSHAWSFWQTWVRPHLQGGEPIVLVLDTFEEVQEDWQRDRVVRWIDALHFEAGFEQLRPIIAGRALPEAWLKQHEGRIEEHVELEDLDPACAAQLLGLLLEKDGAAQADYPLAALAERFGGNPLMLSILARFLAQEGLDVAGELVAGKESDKLRGEFAQGFLYTRMLRRIRADDPDVEKLAYPGLALRRVTPALIERVLAGPCDLRNMDGRRAADLFGKLKTQIWLVRPEVGTSAVIHRRELRRLMLASLPPDKEGVVAEIHRAAAAYYAAGGDPEMSAPAQAVEAIYHSCFTDEPRALADESYLFDFLSKVGEDLQDLPAAVRARLKLRAGRGLTAVEEKALGDDELISYRSLRASAGLAAGYSEPSAPPLAKGFASASTLDIETEAAAAFSAVDFDRFPKLEGRIVESFVEQLGGSKPRGRRVDVDLTETAIWRSAMIAIAGRRTETLSERLQHEFMGRGNQIAWQRPFTFTNRRSPLSVGQIVAALLVLLDSPLPEAIIHSLRETSALRTIDLLEKLRVAALLRADKGIRLEPSLHLSMDVVAVLDPAAMKNASAILKSPPHRQFRRMLEPGRPASGETPILLSTVAKFTSETVPANPGLLFGSPMARGVTRELYLPVQTVVRAAAAVRLVGFAAHVAQKLPAWPVELRPDVLQGALARDPKRWVATMIESADRASLLLDLLDRIADGHPDPARQAQVRALVVAYDKRLRRAVGEPR